MRVRSALAASIVVVLFALALAPQAAKAQRTISVTGDASLTAANDAARISFSVDATRGTRRAALATASGRLRRVLAALRRRAVVSRDLRTGSVGLRRLTVRRGQRRIIRYRARSGVRAVLRDASRAGLVLDAAVAAGATVTSGPTFFIADSNAFFRRALVAAFRDARQKATALAAEAGLPLGRPISVRESTFEGEPTQGEGQPVRGNPEKRRAEAPTPTEPGRSRVDAEVFVVFEAG